jgi:hypothetical protein
LKRRLIVCAVAAFAFPGAALAARPAAVPDCLGKPTVRPTAIVFACADGNFGAKGLRWTGWGESFAAATGSAYANDCTPYCAAGKFHRYRAVIVASGLQRCPGGVVAYSRLTVGFVGPTPYPKATPSDLVYPVRCR